MNHQQQEKPKQTSKTPTRSSEPALSVRDEAPMVFQLQHALGNQGVLRLLRSRAQAKLTVSSPEDVYEQEADRVADDVMRMPSSVIQTRPGCPLAKGPSCGDEEAVQKKAFEITPLAQRQPRDEEELVLKEGWQLDNLSVSRETEDRINTLQGGGQSLPESVRSFMEPRFGADFSQVRVHTDAGAAELARAVKAHAFTVGKDIVFGNGQYAPDSKSGKKLLAHELTHVVQQRGSEVRRAMIVQRAAECSIGHLETECAGATAKCLAIQDSYCKKKYPKPGDIETLHQNAIKGANGQGKKYPFAAENLLHFLDGSGTEKVMTVDIFRDHPATKDKLADEHRRKFIGGAEKRLKSGELKPGAPVEMTWTGTANAFSFFGKDDLGLAVGGYTLCSKAKASVTDKGSGKYDMIFDAWTVQAFDCYNWDPGKGIGLPGADDNDLCCLQNVGKGRYFKIRTDAWSNTYAPSMEKETISG